MFESQSDLVKLILDYSVEITRRVECFMNNNISKECIMPAKEPMDIFDQLKKMKTRTFFLVFGPISIIGTMLIFSYCLYQFGDMCWRILPPI